jgi:N-acyl-D-amino-acid deacylase
MDPQDVAWALRQPWAAFSTDSEHRAADGPLAEGRPHPRAYGAFTRVLGRHVREDALFPLEEAVRKATGLPAQILGLRDRGLVREGFHADLVAFDPATVIDRATYEEPHQYSTGIDYVVVGGQVVVDEGRLTAARPGRIVRGPEYRGPQGAH